MLFIQKEFTFKRVTDLYITLKRIRFNRVSTLLFIGLLAVNVLRNPKVDIECYWLPLTKAADYIIRQFFFGMGALTSVICVLIRKLCIMSPCEDEEVDSNTGLKVKEKRAISQTWKYISRNLRRESLNFLNLLLIEYPDYIEYFPNFRGMKLEEFNKTPKYIAIARSVFCALTLIVDSLDEPDELVEILHTMGRDHYKRGVPIEAFHTLPNVFDKFFTSRLGKTYTPLVKESWMKVLAVMNAVMEKGMEDTKAAKLEQQNHK